MLDCDDATLDALLEMRRQNRLATMAPSRSNIGSELTNVGSTTSKIGGKLAPESTTEDQQNEVSADNESGEDIQCNDDVSTDNESSEDIFQCNLDDEDPSFKYDSNDESDDDYSENDSGIATIPKKNPNTMSAENNDGSQNAAINACAWNNEATESANTNDDGAPNDNDATPGISDAANEKSNIVGVASTSGQAKKTWFDEKTFYLEAEYKAYLKKEHFAITRRETRTKIHHISTRCNLVKKKGKACDAQLAVRYYPSNGTYVVQSNQRPHTCEKIANKVPLKLRLDVQNMRKVDVAPRQACQVLQETYGETAININQLYGLNKTYDARNKRRFTTIGEVIEHLENRKQCGTDDDAYVLDIKHSVVSADQTELQFVVSTRRLLLTALRFRVLSCDATYKTNVHGYPLMILGGLDANQKLHVLAYCITTNEKADNYRFLFETVASAIWRLYQEELKPHVLVADGAIAIANGFMAAFPNIPTKIIMCYFHVKYNIKKHLHGDNAEAILNDIDKMQNSSSPRIFLRAVEMFEAKWQDVEQRFCKYFVRNWVRMRSGWYEGFERGCASTNNGMEGHNGAFKTHYTYRKLLQMGVLYDVIGRVLHDKSKTYIELDIVTFPTIKQNAWIEAVEWSQMENLGDILKVQSARKSVVYVPSGKMRKEGLSLTAKMISDYEALVVPNLSELIDITQRMYRVELDNVAWQNSTCSCVQFCKKGTCKHVLGMAIKMKFVEPPATANPAPLSQPSKLVPNVRAAPALQKQPYYADIATAHLPSLSSTESLTLPSTLGSRNTQAKRTAEEPLASALPTQSKRRKQQIDLPSQSSVAHASEPMSSSSSAESKSLQPPSILPPRNTRAKRTAEEPPASALPTQNKRRKQQIDLSSASALPTKSKGQKQQIDLPTPSSPVDASVPMSSPLSIHLIAFGGLLNSNSASGQSFKDGEWSKMRAIKQAASLRAANCSYAHNDGEILISGGINGATLKRTAIINLRDGKVTKLGSMQTARCAHASAFFADTYFVAGGHLSSSVNLDSVEK